MKRSSLFRHTAFLILIPAILFFTTFILQYKNPVTIYPENKDFIFNIYGDFGDYGNSQVQRQINQQNEIEITYTLKEGYEYPNITLVFTNPQYTVMDLSGFDQISLNLESEKSNFALLQFSVFLPGYSETDDYESYIPVAYYLELNNPDNTYTIPLDQFKPHSWWLALNQVSPERADNVQFSSTAAVSIATDPSFPFDVEDTIFISGLSFETNLHALIIQIIIILAVYYCIYLITVLVLRRSNKIKHNREKIILVPYASAELPETDNVDSLVENYICSHYTEPLLNIAMVEDETQVTERAISKLLKSKYNYSFPGFVNFLRISEAKKLLKSTDMKIVDIAMTVGYNSLGHFNRTFKKEESITPREFKKQKISTVLEGN